LYAIKMNNDKSLVTTVHAMIYQNECNADTLVFVIPKTYDNIEMANCSMLMRYILPDGVGKSEEIEMDPIPYNSEYYVYRLKAGSRFTKIAGKIELSAKVGIVLLALPLFEQIVEYALELIAI